jgi:FkbM family methyltransferase
MIAPTLPTGGTRVRRIFDRNAAVVLAAPFRPASWRSLFGQLRVVSPGPSSLYRYVTQHGQYPWSVAVRTPLGRRRVELESRHDLLTVNEVFCRQDYGRCDGRVFVDIGANIGVAALYFLTRRPDTRVHCYEPDPRNVARLRRTLAGFEDRYVLHEVAVSVRSESVRFFTEETGRYGRIDDDGDLQVDAVGIIDLLTEVVALEGSVDLLKVDTEGTEPELVAAIPAELHVRRVYWEELGFIKHVERERFGTG